MMELPQDSTWPRGFVRGVLSNTLLIVSLLTMTFCFVLLFILFLRVGYGQVKRRVGRLGSGQESYGTFRASIRVNLIIAVVGPSIWNGLPLSIRSLPRTLSQTFLSQVKAVLFGRVGVGSASE